jgi:hypothetical protein
LPRIGGREQKANALRSSALVRRIFRHGAPCPAKDALHGADVRRVIDEKNDSIEGCRSDEAFKFEDASLVIHSEAAQIYQDRIGGAR